MSLVLRIVFESDWHVGAGFGRSGDTDRLIAKETVLVEGKLVEVPVLPAKTLTGVLRDAAETLALGLDGGRVRGEWADVVTEIFGGTRRGPDGLATPKSAELSVRPGRLSGERIYELAHSTFDLDEFPPTTERSFVAIDENGAARDGSLRRIELGRMGDEFIAEVTISDALVSQLVYSVLVLACALVEGVGAKRRRGLGRCTLTLQTVGEEDLPTVTQARDFLENLVLHPGSALDQVYKVPRTSRTNEPSVTRGVIQSPQWWEFDMDIVCETPLLVTGTATGNSVRSLDYVPGRALLPLICSRLSTKGIDANSLVRSGALMVTNALPFEDDEVFLPMPFAFSRLKVAVPGEHEVWNTLLGETPSQAKQLRGGFVSRWVDEQGSLRHKATAYEIRAHNVINDDLQRPDETTGGLYTYQAIATGSKFRARVSIQLDEGAAVRVPDALRGPASIGRSRKDDYGAVQLKTRTAVMPEATSIPAGSKFIVWCASPVILRDPHNLAPSATSTSLASAVAETLGVSAGSLDVVDFQPSEVIDSAHGFRVRTERIDAFNSRWGLPQPTNIAISAGSVVVMQNHLTTEIPSEAVASLETFGVGERRAEGYGRLIINSQILTVKSFPQIRDPHHLVGRILVVARTNQVVPRENRMPELRRLMNERSVERSAQICEAWKIPVSKDEAPSARRIHQLLDQISRGIQMGQGELAQEWLDRQLTRPTSAKLWGSAGGLLLKLLRDDESVQNVSPLKLLDLEAEDLPIDYRGWALYAALKATSRYRRSSVRQGERVSNSGS